MNRQRGIIWLVAGLILAILAAGLSYYAFQQVIIEQQQALPDGQDASSQTVVVAKELISERSVIGLADLSTEERPIEEVPSGAIFKTDDAVGRITNRSILPGQVLLAQNLVESDFPSSANLEGGDTLTGTINFNQTLGDDLVAYAVPAVGRLSQEGILLPGDHIDLLFSTDVVGQQEGMGGKVSIYAIQDLEVLQIIYQPPPPPPEGEAAETPPETRAKIPKTLILAIEPQDAVVLKYAVDTNTIIDVTLRSEDNRRFFDVDAVTINTIADRYNFVAPRPLP